MSCLKPINITKVAEKEGYPATEYRYPIHFGLRGKQKPTKEEVKEAYRRVEEEKPGHYLDALWLAEISESGEEDHGEYFIGDDQFRSNCVGLNSRVNAWALLYGKAKEELNKLTPLLAGRNFEIYAAGKADELLESDHISLSPRDTGVIYFAQLLVRYALIYARADAGQSHALTHEIEEYAPGVVFVVGELDESEHLMIQGLLALGAPVVILGDKQKLVGMVYPCDSVERMVETAWGLPGVRARLVEKAIPEIPLEVGPAFSKEVIKKSAIEIKGSDESFIAVLPNHSIEEDDFVVLGENDSDDVSLIVELGNEVIDPVTTIGLELHILRVLKYIHGVKITQKSGNVESIQVSEDAAPVFRYEHLSELIQTELRDRYPLIGAIKVTLLLSHKDVLKHSEKVKNYKKKRKHQIDNATEESIDAFYGCTRCASFSLSHACTVTPNRPAQCGFSPWYVLKTQALLSPDDVYSPSQVIPKGELRDKTRGEYTGVNLSTSNRTGGRVERVFLHSVIDHPHTACSCFQNIAYYIPEVNGIALVDRRYKGKAPGGESWTSLANKVAGYQNTEGYATFATSYLKSPKFFQGDVGYSRVVWMTSDLKTFAGDSIPGDRRDKIFTEKDTNKVEDLIPVD